MPFRVQHQDIRPGPCPPEGCPPPTEIVCIDVCKVYDMCSQIEPILATFTKRVPQGATRVECEIVPTPTESCRPFFDKNNNNNNNTHVFSTCEEVPNSRRPLEDGLAAVTVLVNAVIRLTFFNSQGTVIDEEFVNLEAVIKQVVLCAPEGTEIICHVVDGSCSCVIINCDVRCTINLCVIIQSEAKVKLMVPSYGFCTPLPCEAPPPPPPGCILPFPPQCV